VRRPVRPARHFQWSDWEYWEYLPVCWNIEFMKTFIGYFLFKVNLFVFWPRRVFCCKWFPSVMKRWRSQKVRTILFTKSFEIVLNIKASKFLEVRSQYFKAENSVLSKSCILWKALLNNPCQHRLSFSKDNRIKHSCFKRFKVFTDILPIPLPCYQGISCTIFDTFK
jgi:hypothetical protein